MKDSSSVGKSAVLIYTKLKVNSFYRLIQEDGTFELMLSPKVHWSLVEQLHAE